MEETLGIINQTISSAIANVTQPTYYDISDLPTTDVGLIVGSDGYIYSWDSANIQYVSTDILYQAALIEDLQLSITNAKSLISQNGNLPYVDNIADYQICDYIEVEAGDILIYKGVLGNYNGTRQAGIALYNHNPNKNWISNLVTSTTSQNKRELVEKAVTIPSENGVKYYIRGCSAYKNSNDRGYPSYSMSIKIIRKSKNSNNRYIYQSDMTDGVIIASSGNSGKNANYVSIDNIEVFPGQKVIMTGYFGGYAFNSGGIAGYDKNGEFLKRVFDGSINGNPTDATTNYLRKEITIPDNVYYISFSTRKDGLYGIELIIEYPAISNIISATNDEKEPIIYNNEINATISSISEIINASNKNLFTICVFTDLHHDDKYENDPTKEMFANIKELDNRINFDAIYNLGDTIDGQFYDKNKAKSYLCEVTRLMKNISLTKYHSLEGNHDNNVQSTWNDRGGYDSKEKMSNVELFSCLQKDGCNEVHNLNHLTDFYVDYEKYNIRVICLSLDYTTYTSATAEWLSSIALNTTKQVLVLSHCATKPKWGYYNDIENGTIIETALKKFITNRGEIIAYLHGHTHGDMIETDEDISWTEVAINCAKFESVDHGGTTGLTFPSRNANNETKVSFDVICIDTTNRKVKFIRFGAGNDREIKY